MKRKSKYICIIYWTIWMLFVVNDFFSISYLILITLFLMLGDYIEVKFHFQLFTYGAPPILIHIACYIILIEWIEMILHPHLLMKPHVVVFLNNKYNLIFYQDQAMAHWILSKCQAPRWDERTTIQKRRHVWKGIGRNEKNTSMWWFHLNRYEW